MIFPAKRYINFKSVGRRDQQGWIFRLPCSFLCALPTWRATTLVQLQSAPEIRNGLAQLSF